LETAPLRRRFHFGHPSQLNIVHKIDGNLSCRYRWQGKSFSGPSSTSDIRASLPIRAFAMIGLLGALGLIQSDGI
ncbi:hypothetical protein ACCT25_35125, partial [Rhizobium ruizarguesonis]